MTTAGDTQGGEKAAAGAAAPSDRAYQSEVDLSDLVELQTSEAGKAEGAEADEAGKQPTESTDQGDASDDASSEGEDGETDADETDGETEGDDDEGDDEDEKPRKRNRSQRYRDQIQRLQDENARLRGRSASGNLTDAQVDAKVKEIIGAPPKEEDFANYLDFDRAAAAYELDKRQVTRQVKEDAQRSVAADQERKVELADRHRERVEEFRSRGQTADEKKANAKAFDEAMAEAQKSNVKVAPHVEDLILDSRKSGHLTFYFAKNPGKLEQINRMTEREAARAIGAIEARLSVPKPKTKSSAPPPPVTRPRGGSAPPSADADLDAYLKKTYGD